MPAISRYIPFVFYRSRKRRLVGGGRVIAFVGGDGSGKTTNVNALHEWLGTTFDVKTFHLGKPAIRPLRFAYCFISKGIRLMLGNPAEVEINSLYAITAVLVARERWRLAKAASEAAQRGTIVVCDRFPTSCLTFSEALSIPRLGDGSRFLARLGAIEQSYYEKMADLSLPDVTIVLRIEPEAAIARKPDDDPEFIRPRLQEIMDVDWSLLGNAHVIDAGQPLEHVLTKVRCVTWSRLPAWAPHIEFVGLPGVGKTTLTEELLRRGTFASRDIRVLNHPIRVLINSVTLWWAFLSFPLTEWKWMSVVQTDFELKQRNIDGAYPVPIIFDQGPFYHNAAALWLRSGRGLSRKYRRWHRRQINRCRDILDLSIWLEADEPILRCRINNRTKNHEIKRKSAEAQNRFLSDFRGYFESVMIDASGNELFSTMHFRTDDVPPTELADRIAETLQGLSHSFEDSCSH